MLGSALLGSLYFGSATAQTPGMPPELPKGRKAVTWARADIARSNATRSNYIRPHITVLMTKYRWPAPPETIDVSDWVRLGTLHVTQAINDEPDTCALTFTPLLPAAHIPEVGDVIAVGLATEHTGADRRIVGGLEFTGPIMVKQHDRRNENKSPWIAIQCHDWQWFFDAQLINAAWPAQSASTTIRDVLARFVNYSQVLTVVPITFTLTLPGGELPSVPAFEAINWRASDVLRHLANAVQGAFYIDARRAVHVWADGPEPGEADPQPLTNGRTTLKSFRHTVDASQVRRRVVVEGMQTTISTDVPALAPPALYTGGVPVADGDPFTGPHRARIGSQITGLQAVHPLQPAAENPFTAHVIGTSAGEGLDVPIDPCWMKVDAFPPFLGPAPPTGGGTTYQSGWIKVGEQYIRYESAHHNPTFGPSLYPHHFLAVNAEAYPFGKMSAPIKVGTTVTWLDWVDDFQPEAHAPAIAFEPLRAAPAGANLVVLADATDPDINEPWATNLPPIESLVSDGRYGYAGATQRAQEDLLFFRTPAMRAEWITEDYNARPGRGQVILLTDPDRLTAVLTILNVTIEFPLRTIAPRRACTAATVKQSTLLDILSIQSA